jgi:hypothetical protein
LIEHNPCLMLPCTCHRSLNTIRLCRTEACSCRPHR